MGTAAIVCMALAGTVLIGVLQNAGQSGPRGASKYQVQGYVIGDIQRRLGDDNAFFDDLKAVPVGSESEGNWRVTGVVQSEGVAKEFSANVYTEPSSREGYDRYELTGLELHDF